MDKGQLIGFIGIDYVKGFHSPTDEEIQILVLFAEILVLLRNRVAEQLERQNLLETATHQNERLKEFSYITSHNIRSSVANILGLLDLQESDGENPQIHTLLKVSANKLNDTLVNINEILNFEREIEELNRVECRPYQIISNIIETLHSEISDGHIVIKNEIPEDLIIHGFHAYLESVFHNLITNAIKYGTTELNKTIEISSRTESGSCCISFRDYGLGIDLERHGKNLFNLGLRFHSGKSNSQGLGLFMTKRQVDAMKGKIEVVSEINRGATFKVWLNN